MIKKVGLNSLMEKGEMVMAIHTTDIQSLLDAALGNYYNEGFRLVKNGSVLFLTYGSSFIAELNWKTTTISDVQDACCRYLEIGEV